MSLPESTKFLISACHADENTADPTAHWEKIRNQQNRMIERIEGYNKIKLLGPHVDLNLSVIYASSTILIESTICRMERFIQVR
jgi:hypothetical protein